MATPVPNDARSAPTQIPEAAGQTTPRPRREVASTSPREWAMPKPELPSSRELGGRTQGWCLHPVGFSLLMSSGPEMDSDTSAPAKAKPAALRKGALVKVNRQAYSASIEAGASDPTPPDYIFEGPGELLVVKGDYGQVRWNRPVPDVWLRMDQLEAYS